MKKVYLYVAYRERRNCGDKSILQIQVVNTINKERFLVIK